MPVLRCALMTNDAILSLHTEDECPRGVTWNRVAWTGEVDMGDDGALEAKLRVTAPGKEEFDAHHDGDWHKGNEQDARAEKERMARMRNIAWCDFCGNHALGRRCCYGCKQIGVKTYYCDHQCQAAAWRLQPKHRCGR